MGKGDKKTRRGKIIMGSYGVRRPKKSKIRFVPDEKPKAKAASKQADIETKEPVKAKKTTTKKTTVKKTDSAKATDKKTTTNNTALKKSETKTKKETKDTDEEAVEE